MEERGWRETPFFVEDDLVKLDRDTRGAKRRWEDEAVVTLWDGGEDEVDDGSATTQLWSRAHLEVHFHTGQCIHHEKHWISLTCSTREPVRGEDRKVTVDLDAHAVQYVNRANCSPQYRRYWARRQQPLLLHMNEGRAPAVSDHSRPFLCNLFTVQWSPHCNLDCNPHASHRQRPQVQDGSIMCYPNLGDCGGSVWGGCG